MGILLENTGRVTGMEAKFARTVLHSRPSGWMRIATLLLVSMVSVTLNAASFRTRNFIVEAATPALARQVAEQAESYRKQLAMHWLGAPLPAWPNPCPIQVVSGPHLPAQGVTTYNPIPARDFQMEVVGSQQRILDSVLPHEITHTVLATHFGRPLPRCADEGICTTVEHESERSKHEVKLLEFLRSHRGIAMNQLFLMKDYPADVLPMYAQGYSVCQFLIDQKGPREFIRFLGNYLRHPSWTKNLRNHYGYESLQEFQDYWIAWVAAGSGSSGPYVKLASGEMPAEDQKSLQIASLLGSDGKVPGQMPEPRSMQSDWVFETIRSGPSMVSSPSMGSSLDQQKKRAQATPPLRPAPSMAIDKLVPPLTTPTSPGSSLPPSESDDHSQLVPITKLVPIRHGDYPTNSNNTPHSAVTYR